MASIADAFSERIGPLPAWAWALGVGAGLYLFAHYQSTKAAGPGTLTTGNPTFSPFAGGAGALFGSPAALAGPVLQPNPQPTTANSLQPGAATTPNAVYVPSPQPPTGGAITGGDNPFTAGYVGLARPTVYSIARGGPS